MRYYSSHESRPNRSNYLPNTMVNRLILANVVVFFLEYIFAPHFVRIFALSPADVVRKFYFWQPLTYMFLHAGFLHLFFNMLMTWFFGNNVEQVWGSKKFLKYYITCGLGGALFSIIFSFNSAVIGASGAVFGIYLAYGMLFPNSQVFLYFLFPIKAKYFVTFIALFQLAHGISGPSGIAYFAHLGGMAAGLFFFRREIMASKLWTRTLGWWGTYNRTRREEWESHESAKIDSILDKIASKGYENLSSTEKRILENYSRKQKDDSE